MPASAALPPFYFAGLPAELRDAIWEQCLPFRVVDVENPRSVGSKLTASPKDYQTTEEDLDCEEDAPACCDWKLGNTKQWAANSCCPPIISRVCREARRVAMRNGGWLKLSWYSPVWLDPARDLLHLPWSPLSGGWDDSYNPGLIGRFLTCHARRLSINYDLCLSTKADPPDYGEWVHRQLEQRRSYELCLGTAIIHVAPRAEGRAEEDAQEPVVAATGEDPVVSSGLFGLFGEEHVKQISATDSEQLAKFAAFNTEHGSPRDERAAKFFRTRLLQASDDVEAHMVELRAEWLGQLWEEAARKDGLAKIEGGGESVFAPRQVDPYMADFDEPDWNHPWVRSVMRQMPTFRPIYIVRLCTRRCA